MHFESVYFLILGWDDILVLSHLQKLLFWSAELEISIQCKTLITGCKIIGLEVGVPLKSAASCIPHLINVFRFICIWTWTWNSRLQTSDNLRPNIRHRFPLKWCQHYLNLHIGHIDFFEDVQNSELNLIVADLFNWRSVFQTVLISDENNISRFGYLFQVVKTIVYLNLVILVLRMHRLLRFDQSAVDVEHDHTCFTFVNVTNFYLIVAVHAKIIFEWKWLGFLFHGFINIVH